MRKQTRPPIPPILVQHGEQWARQWAALRARNPKAAFQWYQADGRSARDHLLSHLRSMTQSHCAFCDSFPLDDRSSEPIEHFKPKSDPPFYADAYRWENLYYCCELCQGTKREQWDERLLRPDASDYSFESYFVFDYTTGEIKPNPVVSAQDQARAKVTIQLYGLDLPSRRQSRRLELRRCQRGGSGSIDEWAYRDFLE
ncbi:MAG: TIGR02646 family protein [Planctomycetota bacterium]|nr:TIGR02646 family protein [Planctomycetota bacterium]